MDEGMERGIAGGFQVDRGDEGKRGLYEGWRGYINEGKTARGKTSDR